MPAAKEAVGGVAAADGNSYKRNLIGSSYYVVVDAVAVNNSWRSSYYALPLAVVAVALHSFPSG